MTYNVSEIIDVYLAPRKNGAQKSSIFIEIWFFWDFLL